MKQKKVNNVSSAGAHQTSDSLNWWRSDLKAVGVRISSVYPVTGTLQLHGVNPLLDT